jgi:hypothetical protein
MHMQQRPVGLLVAMVAVIATVIVGACGEAGETRSIALDAVKSSGVSGQVKLTDVGDGRTRVEIEVDPAGNLDMPAHIHPGVCGNITPQPRFPLANVANGRASTVVPASLAELMTGNLAVTLHKSNENLKITSACGTLVVG